MAEKEYIEREAALQFVFDACAECMDACEEFDGIYADCNQCMLKGVKLKLRDLPAADVRPVVRGKWISHDFAAMGKGRYTGSVECSACGRFLPLPENFCPNCGALMEERKE